MKNKKIKKFFRSLLFMGIIATIIGSIIAELFSKYNILTAIFNLFVKIINLIVKFFSISIPIPLWIFILLLIPEIVFFIIIIGLLIRKKKSSPYFSSYTRDKVDSVVWEWNWEYKKLSRKYNIEDLLPFCPKCDCQLTHSDILADLVCPNCNFRRFYYPKSDIEVKMIINQRINRMLSQNQNKG